MFAALIDGRFSAARPISVSAPFGRVRHAHYTPIRLRSFLYYLLSEIFVRRHATARKLGIFPSPRRTSRSASHARYRIAGWRERKRSARISNIGSCSTVWHNIGSHGRRSGGVLQRRLCPEPLRCEKHRSPNLANVPRTCILNNEIDAQKYLQRSVYSWRENLTLGMSCPGWP